MRGNTLLSSQEGGKSGKGVSHHFFTIDLDGKKPRASWGKWGFERGVGFIVKCGGKHINISRVKIGGPTSRNRGSKEWRGRIETPTTRRIGWGRKIFVSGYVARDAID